MAHPLAGSEDFSRVLDLVPGRVRLPRRHRRSGGRRGPEPFAARPLRRCRGARGRRAAGRNWRCGGWPGSASSDRARLRRRQVFDGTGADPFAADVAVADGLIAEVGSGLDGDEVVDVLRRHRAARVHRLPRPRAWPVSMDELKLLHQPFSYQFYEAATNLRKTLHAGITTVRDAGGADLGVQRALEHGLIVGPRMQISITILSQTGGHGDGWLPSGGHLRHLLPASRSAGGVVDGPDEMRRVARTIDARGRAGAQGVHDRWRAVPAGRPAAQPVRRGRARGAHRRGRDAGPVRDGPRARRRGHQERGPGRGPLDRARHLRRRRGHRADGRARHLPGADPDRADRGDQGRGIRCADIPLPWSTRPAKPPRPTWTRCAGRTRPACGSRWAPTPVSARTARTWRSCR